MPELRVNIPKPDALSHISPLPLHLPVLLHFGLIDLESEGMDIETRKRIQEAFPIADEPIDRLFAEMEGRQTAGENSASGTHNAEIPVSAKIYAAMQSLSVDICRESWGAARFSRSSVNEGEWKHELSFLDIERLFAELASGLEQTKKGPYIIVSRDA